MASRETNGVSRRKFLRRAATASAAAVAGRGIYSVLDDFAGPNRAYAMPPYREEQYLIDGLELLYDNGVTVVIPPIYNDVITAKVNPALKGDRTGLRAAKQKLETSLSNAQQPYRATAAGLTVVVGWGLPYFTNYVPGPWGSKMPKDTTVRPAIPALLEVPGPLNPYDQVPFPSDPPNVVHEQNDVAFKLRSDSSDILDKVEKQLFFDPNSPDHLGKYFTLTSKRIGFLGRGFGTTSAAKALAVKAKLKGADSIPDKSQLMMGFTSTQGNALGPDNIPSLETLRGLTDQWPNGYWAAGTIMHLSHLYLDLEAWYGKPYAERVQRMLSPRTAVPAEGTVTLPNGPPQVAKLADVKADAEDPNVRLVGHNSALQMATRTGIDNFDNYGNYRPKGTSVPAREDFNTIDDPFAWYRDGKGAWVDNTGSHQPGLHFAVFVPGSARFHTARKAMDGVFPGGTNLRIGPKAVDDTRIGFNAMMKASHRQNFLVPPRTRRSFPLVELL